jgi:hypothetical protein
MVDLYSKHQTIGLAIETALGTAGTTKEIRWDEATFPVKPQMNHEQPNLGHEHMGDTSDRPVIHATRQDDAANITVKLRKDNTTDDAVIVDFLESAGANNNQVSDTTIDTYTSTTSFTLAADNGAIGSAAAIGLTGAGWVGQNWPTLTAAYPGASEVTPSMALPAATANGSAYTGMYTVVPAMGAEVSTSATLTFTESTRAPHTTSEDWNFVHSGCALSSLGPVVFEPGGDILFPCTFHVAKTDDAAGAIAASVFRDLEKHTKIDEFFEFGYANADNTGAIASNSLQFHRAEWTPGINCLGRTATGGGGVVGDTSHYFGDYEPSTVVVDVAFKKVYFDDFQTEAQTFKYLHFIQPSDALSTKPCMGLWMPKCSLIDAEYVHGENWVEAKLTYKASSATYGSDTSNDSRENAPWYLAVV